MKVNVKGNIPTYAKNGDAGADLISTQDVIIGGGQTVSVKTGTFIEIPEGYVGLIHPRSGLAYNHGLTVLNAPGTIDSGFRGELQVILHNSGGHAVPISRGMRIAQLVIQEFVTADFVQVDELSSTERGDGGFGSTGN
jgi:dUTP pyrophosphatase